MMTSQGAKRWREYDMKIASHINDKALFYSLFTVDE
jgi:hypothetical protein